MDAIAAAVTASAITWAATAGGAALVFVTPRLPRRGLAMLLGTAAVLMTWAAFAGLLQPALAMAWDRLGVSGVGGAILALGAGIWAAQAIRRRLTGIGHGPVLGRQLFLVMTLHHVPEGMAVGLAVAAAVGGDAVAAAGSGALVLAMALHNTAEGALVSLPLRQEGMGPGAAWMRGQLSGIAEVAGAVLGALAATAAAAALPWALAAAAGAMLAVVVGDLLPELRTAWRGAPSSARAAT